MPKKPLLLMHAFSSKMVETTRPMHNLAVGLLSGLISESLIPHKAEAVSHHEAYDGNGYPLGLKGEEIPFLSRIITIADIFDALTSSRSYRKAYNPDEAVRIMEQEMGFMFDPEIFEVSKGILKEISKGRLKLT